MDYRKKYLNRTGFKSGSGILASAPWYRGTTGPSQILKAPRGYTGMQEILAGGILGTGASKFLEDEDKENLPVETEETKLPKKEPPEGEPDLLPELTKSTAEEVIRKQIKEKEGTYFPEVVEDLEIQELIENYRKSKTKEGSTQPTLKLYEKIDLVNSVVDTFKKKYNRLPSHTELKTFFPKLSNLAEVIREGDIEIGKAKADYDRTNPEYVQLMEEKFKKFLSSV